MQALRNRLRDSTAALRGVFANPGLRWVQLGYAGASIGTYANSIAVSVYAYRHGGATAVGVFMALRLGIAALVAPFGASIGDRYPRERVMLGSDLVRAIVVGGAAFAAASGLPLLVYGLAIVSTAVGTVFRPAASALLPTLARSPEELAAANVASSTFDSVGSFVGPALAALLLAVSSTATVFALVAATFAWSAICISRVRGGVAPAELDAVDEEELYGGVMGGVRAIRAEARLRLLIGLYGAQCLVAGALGVLVIVIALDVLSLGNAGVGLLEGASGVGSILGAGVALALVKRRRLAADLAIGIVLWGAPLALIGAVPLLVVAVLALAVVGIGNTLVDISAMTLLQRSAPGEAASRVFGVLESVIVGALALGALVAPALVALVGARGALLAVGAFLPVLAALRWRQLALIDHGALVPDAQLDAVASVPFLAMLPLATRERLAGALAPLDVQAGETLFRHGDRGDRFYVLVAGSLEIDLPEGTKVEQAPAYVGEIALLKDVPRTATVRAASAVTLWSLGREEFLGAVLGHARASTSADAVVAARLGAA